MNNNDVAVRSLHQKAYDEVNQCIQCGYCLPVCPTYISMGTETASPRGRINLVKMAAEGNIDILEDLKEPIDFCLGCRACEIACPVNVPYGSILEHAKEAIYNKEIETKQNSKFKDFALNLMFTNKKSMKLMSDLYYLYQQSGIQQFTRKTNLPEKIIHNVGNFEKALPKVPKKKFQLKRGKLYAAKTEETKQTVALFLGCINDALFYHVNYYTLELLRLSGCDVYIPKEQTCCGAIHAHQGQLQQAKQLAKENLTAFQHLNVTAIITNAGGCGATLKEYDHLLKNEKDSNWTHQTNEFTSKIKDISEILYTLNLLPFCQEVNETVTYQPSCHLSNVQKAGHFPEKLIRQVPGITYIELPSKNFCCASGGVYNIEHYDESMEILSSKMSEVNDIKPDIVITSNPGCFIQMSHGINTYGEKQSQSMHLVELLAKACDILI